MGAAHADRRRQLAVERGATWRGTRGLSVARYRCRGGRAAAGRGDATAMDLSGGIAGSGRGGCQSVGRTAFGALRRGAVPQRDPVLMRRVQVGDVLALAGAIAGQAKPFALALRLCAEAHAAHSYMK